jgi:signal transduction histidine kinase
MQLVRRPGESGTFISVARDLTERKKVEQMKNEFISTVSHELRTPVTSIRGSLGLLAGGVAGELTKQARELVDIATSNSERLILLINDILDIEKIESGKMRFNLGPVRLREVLDTALQANRGYAQRFGVELVLAGEAPDITVTADGDRLLQVLANLLSNAAKFSPAGGKVEVSAARRGDGVRVQVRDHGSGIPADFQDKIFGKFSQADSSDTRRLGGTGLGLSIAKAIVEKHGGTIGFETAPGAGTTFHFDLPLAPPAVERAESAGQASG